MPSTTDQKTFLNIPETVSKEAQEFLRTLKDPALSPPFPEPTDMDGWRKVQAFVEIGAKGQSPTSSWNATLPRSPSAFLAAFRCWTYVS